MLFGQFLLPMTLFFSDMKCKSIGTSIVLVFGCILIDYYSRSLNVKFPLTLASLSCSSLIICFPLYALTGNLLLIIISPKNGPTQKLKNTFFSTFESGMKIDWSDSDPRMVTIRELNRVSVHDP